MADGMLEKSLQTSENEFEKIESTTPDLYRRELILNEGLRTDGVHAIFVVFMLPGERIVRNRFWVRLARGVLAGE